MSYYVMYFKDGGPHLHGTIR